MAFVHDRQAESVRVYSSYSMVSLVLLFFFFLNDTAPPDISTLPLPDALPILQHDDQWERLPLIAAGDVELVGAGSGRVAVGRFNELPARRHDVRRGHWSGLPQAMQSEPREIGRAHV